MVQMLFSPNATVLWPRLQKGRKTGTLANSEDPDEMQPNAAFHQGLHYLPRLKQPSETEIHYNLENITCDPLKCTMDSPMLIISSAMCGKIHQNTV